MSKVKVKLLSDKGKLPTRATDKDSGYDLTFTGIHKIENDVIFFKTDIAVQPSLGYYFEIFPRSSISKLPLMLANSVAVIDEGYTGEILVPIRVMHKKQGSSNGFEQDPMGLVDFMGKKPNNMKDLATLILTLKPVLTQMVLKKRLDVEFEAVQEFTATERGAGGFGSSDKK